ncbi:MAG: glycosyltransferase [Candidatus Eremiobacteraeota bacterium]|nr:glycosyltransferase [Candidatus Eremiobacteraeota bacterium]
MGIETQRTTILLMGGGLGIGPLENAVLAIDRLHHDFQTLIIVGKNPGLEKRLADMAVGLRHQARVLGFVPNVYDYMRAADVLVSKPGGLTSSEALASGLPLIMLRPLPGQEERNTRHLQDKGVGVRVQNFKELTAALDKLLGNPGLLDRMRRHARNLARPNAADGVAELIASLSR